MRVPSRDNVDARTSLEWTSSTSCEIKNRKCFWLTSISQSNPKAGQPVEQIVALPDVSTNSILER